MSNTAPVSSVMDSIVSLAKRRGFVYQASEIYGGIRGFWDYGPLGVLLKNNIRDHWWRHMVECPPIGPDGEPIDMVGLDSSIIQHPKTWEASGHVATFTDPMVDCRACNARFRADKVFFVDILDRDSSVTLGDFLKLHAAGTERAKVSAVSLAPLTVVAAFAVEGDSTLSAYSALEESIHKHAKKSNNVGLKTASVFSEDYARVGTMLTGAVKLRDGTINALRLRTATDLPDDYTRPCPNCAAQNTLTEPRLFNLMLDTYPGPIRDEANKAYLRPETAQGIFLNYKNVLDTTRVRVPFGVAQVGKSFRNEVTPRNFIFRSREFEQMEMEFFCPPDDALKWYAYWKQARMDWWLSLGINPDNLKFRDHDADELAHYSKACVDIEYRYPFTAPDFGELEGIAHRGSFDLTQHQTHSGAKLDYFDQELQLRLKAEGVPDDEVKKRSRYIPNVIEPASGLTRAVLVLLCEAYTVEARSGTDRFQFFKFKPSMAPIKAGIFPLVNKDGMPEVANKLYLDLRTKFTCEYDAKQSIGKRYARMDEIGTPFSVTVDGESLKDHAATIRERDTQAQTRVGLDKVESYIRERL